MARRFPSRSTPTENMRHILRFIPWKLLLILPILIIIAIPAYQYGTHSGGQIMPAINNFFLNLGANPPPVPTPHPALMTQLPLPGSITYTVREGDNCVEILALQMRMMDAGQVFSDAKPASVKALNASIGRDCHALQPGMVLKISPQYPLMALGGLVLKVSAAGPTATLPTPLINVAPQTPTSGIDCSSGCLVTIQLAPNVRVTAQMQTDLPVHIGSWLWIHAMYPRAQVRNVSDYPYPSPQSSLNGASLRVCDIQVDDTFDANSATCDELMPNTIDDDGGAWLYGVMGVGALDHWSYHLSLPAGTHVLLWLSVDNNGRLKMRKGNPIYRYDAQTQLYVRA